jgi:glutaredoxin 3
MQQRFFLLLTFFLTLLPSFFILTFIAAKMPMSHYVLQSENYLLIFDSFIPKKFTNCCFFFNVLAQCKNGVYENFNRRRLMLANNSLHQIEIYTKDSCPYCVRAIDLLEKKNVIVMEINLSEEPERITEMIERSQRKTVPQIFIDHHHIGGCDDLYDLESAGKLDLLLS